MSSIQDVSSQPTIHDFKRETNRKGGLYKLSVGLKQTYLAIERQIPQHTPLTETDIKQQEVSLPVFHSPLTTYKAKREIGKGSQGTVYVVINKSSKYFALKVSHPGKERNPVRKGDVEVDVDVIKMCKKAGIPNIVKCVEGFFRDSSKSQYCAVYELCESNLYKLLQERAPNIHDIRYLGIQIFKTLALLDAEDIVHGNLNLKNMLVRVDSLGNREMCLTGFGLAFDNGGYNDTKHTIQISAPRAPEVVTGNSEPKAAIDVWSGACLLYQLFTGSELIPSRPDSETREEQNKNLYFDMRKFFGFFPNKNLGVFMTLFKEELQRSLYEKRLRERLLSNTARGVTVNSTDYVNFEDLLKSIFVLNPTYRPTAAQVLQHKFFSQSTPLPLSISSGVSSDDEQFSSFSIDSEQSVDSTSSSSAPSTPSAVSTSSSSAPSTPSADLTSSSSSAPSTILSSSSSQPHSLKEAAKDSKKEVKQIIPAKQRYKPAARL